MSKAIIRTNGLLRPDPGGEGNVITVTFRSKRIKLSTALSKSGLNLISDKISFCAINGVRSAGHDWVGDGVIIDIFPIVTGG